MLQTQLIAPIPELLRRQALERGSKTAFRDAFSSVTYGELETRTENLAGHLVELGVQSGAKVAILLPNSVQWVESCFAINRAGAISVPISYDATESEVLYRLQDAGCVAVITTDERSGFISAMFTETPDLKTLILVDRGPARGEGLRYSEMVTSQVKASARDPSDVFLPAFIIYTSGTTGRAKGVLLTVHGMMWVAAASWTVIAGLSERDVVLSPLPLFHSYALNLSVLSILAVGASEFIMEKFSTKEVCRLLSSGEFTMFPGVPTMFNYLVEAANSDPTIRFPNLRVCISAGAIMPAALNERFERQFGVQLLDGYGITEASTMVIMNWPTGGRTMGSCGLPLLGLSVRIVSASSGNDVAVGEEGELILRGPCIMSGYHNKPEETASVLRNGWYYTGDLAKSDANGYITITGRLKELVIRGGQNIAPAEIEEAVNDLDSVIDSAVIGIPHPHLGEVPILFVVSRFDRSSDNADSILAHCRERLSSYKVPASVYFIDEIPRTGSGKIMRFKLKSLVETD